MYKNNKYKKNGYVLHFNMDDEKMLVLIRGKNRVQDFFNNVLNLL